MNHIAQELDSYAGAYECTFPYFEENIAMLSAYGKRIVKFIVDNKSASALSLGVGYTEVFRKILEQLTTGILQHYVIVDGSPKIIETLRNSITPFPRGLELLEGFFETFEYSFKFDVIEVGFILEHVDDPALILRRLHQFLATNGRIFIAVPNARSLHRLLGHYAGLLNNIHSLSPSDVALGHKRYFDLNSLTTLVQDTGYCIEKTEGILLKPFTTAQLGKLDLSPSVLNALLTVATEYPDISNAIYIEATVCR